MGRGGGDLTHLDLFSGIGGFALAAQAAGFRTVGFSEIEPYACRVLARHWPDVPNFGDIRNVRGVSADLVTGGFPCQPFSLAGDRRGAKDDRHLWPEMRRVIDDTGPTWVLGENVPGIIGMELDNVLLDLENLGYATWPVIVPACAVDARHRRDRVWIVAYSERVGGRAGAERSRREAGPILGRRCAGSTVADADQEGLQGRLQRRERGAERVAGSCVWPDEREWFPQSPIRRVAYGIPNRAHRLRGLGNAIVPQVAEVILRAIAKTMEVAR